MSEEQRAEQRRQLAEFFGTDEAEFVGKVFGDCLAEAERAGAVAFWGFWTDEQLDGRL